MGMYDGVCAMAMKREWFLIGTLWLKKGFHEDPLCYYTCVINAITQALRPMKLKSCECIHWKVN